MATVADYAIVADGWKIDDGSKNTIHFNVPDSIDNNSRCILSFMLKQENFDDKTMSVLINGSEVWNWSWSGGSDDPARVIQEVVSAGVVKSGQNSFQFTTSTDDYELTELSDIVVWFKAKV
jgi:hypothetical protein